MTQVDIREFDGAIEAINLVLNNGNVAEVKIEYKHGKDSNDAQLTVVEQNRRVKKIESVRKDGSDK